MRPLTRKKIAKLSDRTGRKLYDATEALETLVDTIDLGPDLKVNSELEKAFERLRQVEQLVKIAWELYPYPVQDDKEE